MQTFSSTLHYLKQCLSLMSDSVEIIGSFRHYYDLNGISKVVHDWIWLTEFSIIHKKTSSADIITLLSDKFVYMKILIWTRFSIRLWWFSGCCTSVYAKARILTMNCHKAPPILPMSDRMKTQKWIIKVRAFRHKLKYKLVLAIHWSW